MTLLIEIIFWFIILNLNFINGLKGAGLIVRSQEHSEAMKRNTIIVCIVVGIIAGITIAANAEAIRAAHSNEPAPAVTALWEKILLGVVTALSLSCGAINLIGCILYRDE